MDDKLKKMGFVRTSRKRFPDNTSTDNNYILKIGESSIEVYKDFNYQYYVELNNKIIFEYCALNDNPVQFFESINLEIRSIKLKTILK
jgi:hypothetical protein